MNIREFIKDLLLKHNVVVLPGIGGFVAEYEEAKVDPKESKLAPPKKNIKFDTKLLKDESSLLENYLKSKYNLSKDEASEKTNLFLKDLKKELASGVAVEIKDVGYLKLNAKKEIDFEPKPNKNLNLESFGFEAFTQKTQSKSPIKKDPVITTNYNKPEKEWLVLKPYIVFPAAAILVILLLVFLTDLDNALFNRHDKQIAKNDSSLRKTEKNDTELGQSLDEQTNPSVALQIVDKNSNNPDDKYANCTEFLIIAGSFTQFKNAEDLRQQLAQKGYEPKIILSNEKRYRVALKSFNNRQIALKEFETLKQKETDLNIWLLSI